MSSRILVIRGGAIGDFILTLPAIRLLRDGLPDPHLEVLGYPAIANLARTAGIADETRSIEYAGLADFFNPRGDLDSSLVEYFAGFDLVVSYLFDPDGYFAGNLRRAGVKTCLACSHRVDESGPPAALQLARPLEQIALYIDDPAPRLDFPDALHEAAAAHLDDGGAPPVAIHPGSGSPAKNWPVASWIELSDRLLERHPDRRLLVVTGEADRENSAALIEHCRALGERCRFLHSLDLPVLGAGLARCAAFVGHDSGISHLAAAAGAPSLLLFGPTNPEVWAPRNEAVEVLRAPSEDLADIAVAEVLARLDGILSR